MVPLTRGYLSWWRTSISGHAEHVPEAVANVALAVEQIAKAADDARRIWLGCLCWNPRGEGDVRAVGRPHRWAEHTVRNVSQRPRIATFGPKQAELLVGHARQATAIRRPARQCTSGEPPTLAS